MPFYPGPGLGGHCIPIDPFYLTWKAREYGVYTKFIELAGEVNTGMPDYVINRIMEALNSKGKAVNGSKILILGLAYKKNVDDTRETPTSPLIEKLIAKGACVDYSDPHVGVFPRTRRYYFDMKSREVTPGVVSSYDCIVIATDHDKFDWDLIKKHASLIVDTRGVYAADNDRIFRA
jgi:UDP-N-acetyl-D-glucosamine dehydrogenase